MENNTNMMEMVNEMSVVPMNNTDIINIDGVECYEKDGTAYLKLETVARGLGFTTVATSGNECVRWNTVHRYLIDLGVATSCNGSNYRESCPDFIPENIFYRLAMKARNQVAEAFQAKVADEIIPSIRKHGAYIEPETLEKMICTPEFGIRLLTEIKKEREEKAVLQTKLDEAQPKIAFADAVDKVSTTIQVGDLAKILKQNGIDIGRNRLFAWLRDNGYLMKTRKSFNMPSQMAMNLGLFNINESIVTEEDGAVALYKTVRVTGKGQLHFLRKFLKYQEKGLLN